MEIMSASELVEEHPMSLISQLYRASYHLKYYSTEVTTHRERVAGGIKGNIIPCMYTAVSLRTSMAAGHSRGHVFSERAMANQSQ